jgi:putative PEP-CTERM system histidine kinase
MPVKGMSLFSLVQFISAAIGLMTAALVVLDRRFGQASWFLALFLLLASLSAAVLGLPAAAPGLSAAAATRFAWALLVLSAPGGLLASFAVDGEVFRRYPLRKQVFIGFIVACSPFLAALLYFLPARVGILGSHERDVALGPAGYLSAIFLILVAVVALAHLEQTLRSAQEHVRWEIKFLLLGLASACVAILYVSSKVLLSLPQEALLSPMFLRLFPVLFLFACGCILLSWKRSSGPAHVVVGHGVVYSSITLLAVGLYLIATSVVARWAGSWGEPAIPIEATIFLLSILVLAAVVLWADFRHRTRRWIRRYILAGRYDYRRYWLEATEIIRGSDLPEVSGAALADLVQEALGATDVSVWLRLRHPNRLILLAARGGCAESLSPEVYGVIEEFFDLYEPVLLSRLDQNSLSSEAVRFLRDTEAAVVAPLVSAKNAIGLLIVGTDPSRQAFDWEAMEFLGVLTKHAASEFHKAELRAKLIEAKETEAFKTFATFLLHDLKNFASTLSLIARNGTRLSGNPDFQRDALQSIFETAERMKRLCANLRTFSGTLAKNKRLDDLNQIVRRAAESFKAGQVLLQLDLGELPHVFLDAEEIVRVLHNLILNAREAMPAGAEICLRTRCNGRSIELTVEDKGRGMERDFLEKKLFQPFHTTKSDGLGIGLYHSKKIVEAHGGRIRVTSEVGKGTIVSITLPIFDAVPEQKSSASTQNPRSTENGAACSHAGTHI